MKKLMVLVAAIAMISGSAYAADWNFYGSARVQTFYSSTETINTAVDDSDQYEQSLQGNSRIGANVKVSDELTGRFEYGTGVNVRILWGEWNFGSGSLGIGQHYTPLNYFYSNQVFDGDADLLPYGGVYSGRQAMIQLKMGGFKVAFIQPDATNTLGFGTTETSMPTIEANYNLKLDNISMNLGGGYNTFEVNQGATSIDVDSYVVAFGAKADLDAFYVAGNVYMGTNAGHLISIDTDGARSWNDGRVQYNAATNDTDDVDNFGYIVVAGFKVNDMFTVEAGYGYAESEPDSTSVTDEVKSYYANATVTLAPGVFIVPEVGVIDGQETGQEDCTYFGAKWQINF